MERGGWCWSPAPPSPVGRRRIQRLLEQPECSGPNRSRGLQRIAEPLTGILPVRPPHSQTGRQRSGSSPWSAPLGAQGRGEPRTCACCGEVSPEPPGAFPSPAGASSCKLQQLGWVEGWESGAAGKLEAGWKGCRGQESRFLGFSAVQGHLSWGAFGAAALLPPILLRVLALLGCNSGGDPEPRPEVCVGGGRPTTECLGQGRGDWAEMEAQQRAGG